MRNFLASHNKRRNLSKVQTYDILCKVEVLYRGGADGSGPGGNKVIIEEVIRTAETARAN
jgi:hypothetical protein